MVTVRAQLRFLASAETDEEAHSKATTRRQTELQHLHDLLVHSVQVLGVKLAVLEPQQTYQRHPER